MPFGRGGGDGREARERAAIHGRSGDRRAGLRRAAKDGRDGDTEGGRGPC